MDAVAAVAPTTVPLLPAPRAMLREQLAAAGILLRGELLLLALLTGAVTVLMLAGLVRTGRAADFYLPDMAAPALIVGLLTPLALWRNESPSRRDYFWAMPVGRPAHTLARLLAGWAWLLLVVAGYLAWGTGLAFLLGGDVSLGPVRTRVLQPMLAGGDRLLDLGMAGHAWLWLVPFSAATVGYLAASIVALVAEHPWRWFGFGTLAFLLVALVAEGAGFGMPGIVTDAVLGRYGLDALATGLSAQRVNPALVPPTAEGWLSLPDLRAWALTTSATIAACAAGTLAAARRFLER